ncbi:uncharacterized protein MAM_06418 [Metarhizium album ARSEF 1941]|uniref:RFTS domain-containing protein n=1 Tax=Metarhizium album (strain ARSEF 1941) TaxID=1081103 RepID=A0A0B2WIF2_METAS|nr:uncharacterized protein MAM_06418 [Metarhizium album ARSEF 1941]KHN95806.1 hypothetical protein MAM_06418 [Metarhizium album ARSEF 1941]
MPGRRRRASTSSVETVDTSQIRWRQESSVVRSVPKAIPPDDWPVFELQDAIVLNKDGDKIENALHVGHEGPFIVRGFLIIDDPTQRSHLIMKVRGATPLEIRRCASYSIGESPDGRPLIWVSGQGGWYEIDPSPAYKPMYNNMCEATTMYYNMVDIYAEDPPKRSKKSKNNSVMDELAQVFHKVPPPLIPRPAWARRRTDRTQYAARIGDGATLEDVFERANKHSAFFLDQFSHSNGLDYNWKSTAFYKYITTEHAVSQPSPLFGPRRQRNTNSPRLPVDQDLGNRIRDAMERLRLQSFASDAGHSSRENPRSRSAKSSSVEVTDRKALQPSQRPRPASTSTSTSTAPKPAAENAVPAMPLYVRSDQDAAADLPLHSVLSALEDIYRGIGSSKKGMTYLTTLSKLYFNCTFPTYKDSRIGSYKQPADDVLHYYARALVETLDPKYHAHQMYSKLEELATTPFRPLAYRPTEFPIVLAPRKSMPRRVASSQPPSTPNASPQGRASSATQTPRPQGKRPARTPGKSALRPVSRAPKRPHDELESDDGEFPGVKRSHYLDEDDSMDGAPELTSQDENDADADADDDAGADAKETKSRLGLGPIKLVIRADRIPDSSPRGPHDTWTCDEDGCGYTVRGGDEQDCQHKIQQHFRDHERQLRRVNLAVTEGARNHMPIRYAYFPPFLIQAALDHAPFPPRHHPWLPPHTPRLAVQVDAGPCVQVD